MKKIAKVKSKSRALKKKRSMQIEQRKSGLLEDGFVGHHHQNLENEDGATAAANSGWKGETSAKEKGAGIIIIMMMKHV